MTQHRDPSDIEEDLKARGLWDLVEEVAKSRYLLTDELLGRGRLAAICLARFELWSKLRERTGWGTPQLGLMLGVDHSTILAGVKRHAKLQK